MPVRLIAAALMALLAIGAPSALAQPLPDTLRSAGVTQAHWDAVRREARALAQRAQISEAALMAAAEAASANLARSGRFNALSLQQAIFETLSEQADQIAELEQRLAALTGDADPGAAALFAQARAALDEGRLADADGFLAQSAERDLAAIRQADAEAERRRLRAGETIASRGQVAFVQADYLGAAAHYERAARVVPQSAIEARWRYLANQAHAYYMRGDRFAEPDQLERSAQLYQSAVLPLAPRHERTPEWSWTQERLGWVRLKQGHRGDTQALALATESFSAAFEGYRSVNDRSGETLALYGRATVGMILGQRGDGGALERAVRDYTAALSTSPADNVMIQDGLASAFYVQAEQGVPGALDRAVAAIEAALALRSRESDPVGWAISQMNLGNALQLQGERGATGALERSVAAYEAAMLVRTREADPGGWAELQVNLGNAISLLGQRGAPRALEHAISAYEAALGVMTRESHPAGWALAQHGLGRALQHRGDLARAIAAYEAALTVQTRETDAFRWSRAQAALARALLELGSRGSPGTLERSIQAYEVLLAATSRERDPGVWASMQANLGTAHVLLGERGAATSFARAVAALEAALTVQTASNDLAGWVATQRNLGLALLRLGERGEPGALERSISAFRSALAFTSRDTDPAGWGLIQLHIGMGFLRLAQRNVPGALEQGVVAYEAALAAMPREADLPQWASAQHTLGFAYRALGRFTEARTAVQHALSAYQQLGDTNLADQARALLAEIPPG